MNGKKIINLMLMAAMVAVFLRALIPAGFMPDLSAHKPFELVICTADGAHHVAADDKYNPFRKAPAQKHASAEHCEFNLSAVNGFVPQAQIFVLLISAFAAAYLISRKEFSLARRRYYSASPARAPPAFV